MKKRLTSKQFFQTVNLTYYLQAFSLLLFSLVVVFLISQSKTDIPTSTESQWQFAVPFVLILGLATAFFIFRQLVKRIVPNMRLQEKMPKYASALIIRSALLELPGLFSALVAYLTLQTYYVGGAVIIFIAFILLRPTSITMANDMNLTTKERELLENPDAVISEVNQN